MADVFQVDLTKRYFGEWARTLGEEALPVPSASELSPLMTEEVFEDRTSFDATHLAAAQIAQAPAFTGELESFLDSAESARQRLNRMRRLYDDTRRAIEGHKDVARLVLNAQTGSPRELDNKILSYLIMGSSPTRLGEEILLPGKDTDDRPLRTLLGLIRVIAEHQMDEELGLPWLAGNESTQAQRFIEWEIKAGEAGDTVGGALGRAVAVGVTGLLNPFLKLPDELTLGISYITGVVARKGAERQMHRFLEKNPEIK